MQSAVQKNRFAAAMVDDSDDDLAQQKQTKTQKKKEERKITEKDPKPLKVNAQQMMDGAGGEDFQMSGQQTVGRGQRGGRGRGGAEGGDRGGRGQRGGRGGRGRGDRPQTGQRRDADGAPVRLDASGKPIRGASRNDGGQFRGRGQREPGEGRYRGREGAAHDGYERRSGAGRGTRKPAEKKDGAGRFNSGQPVYKVKSQEDEAAADENADRAEEAKGPAEESKGEAKEEVKEEKKADEPQYTEEILGVSLEDFMGGRTHLVKGRAEARAPEQLTGKFQEVGGKQKQSTVQGNQYMKSTVHAKKGDDDQLMNFAAVPDEEEAQGARGGGTRGGKRRGNQAAGPGQGQRRQNQPKSQKQTLKKTEEDYPTL